MDGAVWASSHLLASIISITPAPSVVWCDSRCTCACVVTCVCGFRGPRCCPSWCSTAMTQGLSLSSRASRWVGFDRG
jgi:hypothetical protein